MPAYISCSTTFSPSSLSLRPDKASGYNQTANKIVHSTKMTPTQKTPQPSQQGTPQTFLSHSGTFLTFNAAYSTRPQTFAASTAYVSSKRKGSKPTVVVKNGGGSTYDEPSTKNSSSGYYTWPWCPVIVIGLDIRRLKLETTHCRSYNQGVSHSGFVLATHWDMVFIVIWCSSVYPPWQPYDHIYVHYAGPVIEQLYNFTYFPHLFHQLVSDLLHAKEIWSTKVLDASVGDALLRIETLENTFS